MLTVSVPLLMPMIRTPLPLSSVSGAPGASMSPMVLPEIVP